jgi:hypothetical protein
MSTVTGWITSKVEASNVVSAAKTVYPQVRNTWPDNGTNPDPNASVKRPAVPAQNTMDPETRAQKLAAFARAIQSERPGFNWTQAWIQASTEHPELINSDSDGGPSKISAQRTTLPRTDETASVATFKDIFVG